MPRPPRLFRPTWSAIRSCRCTPAPFAITARSGAPECRTDREAHGMAVDSDANRIDRAPSAMANSGNAGILHHASCDGETARFAGNNRPPIGVYPLVAREARMRNNIVCLAASVLGLWLGATPASAEVTYPWCAQYAGRD